MLGNPSDLVVREIQVGGSNSKCAIIYVNGLTNTELVNNNILKAIQSSNIQSSNNQSSNNQSSNNQSTNSNSSSKNQFSKIIWIKDQSDNTQSSTEQVKY